MRIAQSGVGLGDSYTASKNKTNDRGRAFRCRTASQRVDRDLDKDQEVSAYRDMLLIRRFEPADVRHGPDRRLLSPLHRPEAVVVGMQTLAWRQIITGYRDHGHSWPAGWTRGVMAG